MWKTRQNRPKSFDSGEVVAVWRPFSHLVEWRTVPATRKNTLIVIIPLE